jgi:branched-chain amino acid transport system ATP-binding protein
MAEPILAVEDLNAFYDSAHAVEDVSVSFAEGSTSLIGRNGMGKTTLCNAIMGLPHARVTGSVRFRGHELLGRPSHEICAAGIAYVPQGRRLFPSLSVDEHLRLLPARAARWTPDAVYELFPRLRERRRNGGAHLSGGEQQMLAIGRALTSDPAFLIMDEPSEGLAPTVVEHLIEAFERLVEQEGLSILLVEQNLAMATRMAERQLVMVSGRIVAETTSSELAGDPDLQRRYLGVEPLVQGA